MVLIVLSKGPSSEEWEENREIITDLYKTTTVAHLQELMIKRGFKATLKMYKTQFQRWGLTKYMKAAEKEKHIAAIRESGCVSQSSSTYPGLDVDDLRKIIRHIKMQARDESKGTKKRCPRQKMRQTSNMQKSSVGDEIAVKKMHRVPFAEASAQYSNGIIHTHCYDLLSSDRFYQPSFIHTTTAGPVNMFLLISSIQNVCAHEPMTTDLSKNRSFWSDIKHAIYFLRISSHIRAWSTLNKACENLGKALQDIPAPTFAKEALVTLSPPNMRCCPEVRQQLVQYMAAMSQIDLGKLHPITVLLQQLSLDSDTREVSEHGLMAMSQLCFQNPTTANMSLAIETQLSTSRLLRKDMQYNEALSIAAQAAKTALQTFGSVSRYTLSALRYQEHVLIDTGDYEEALRLCFSIIETLGIDVDISCSEVPYELVVHTMEDIAHIYLLKGDDASKGFWLRKAESAAQRLWGDLVATAHITDKILGVVV